LNLEEVANQIKDSLPLATTNATVDWNFIKSENLQPQNIDDGVSVISDRTSKLSLNTYITSSIVESTLASSDYDTVDDYETDEDPQWGTLSRKNQLSKAGREELQLVVNNYLNGGGKELVRERQREEKILQTNTLQAFVSVFNANKDLKQKIWESTSCFQETTKVAELTQTLWRSAHFSTEQIASFNQRGEASKLSEKDVKYIQANLSHALKKFNHKLPTDQQFNEDQHNIIMNWIIQERVKPYVREEDKESIL